MVTTHNLGFPRIGANRELKKALEATWNGAVGADHLEAVGADLRRQNWGLQAEVDVVPVGDFSFYDHVLDTSVLVGNLPARVAGFGDPLERYFQAARGPAVAAAEMTKWFDTNYHYLVPEVDAGTAFRLDAGRLLAQVDEARALGLRFKPVVVGPLTYLALAKAQDAGDRLALLPRLVAVYRQLVARLADAGCDWVQFDEPILGTELESPWVEGFRTAYRALADAPGASGTKVRLMVTAPFGPLAGNRALALELPVAGFHLDAIAGRDDAAALAALWPADKVLSLGVVSGRNVWKTDLGATLDWLEPLARTLGDRLWLAPSCSLLHVPVDLGAEVHLDVGIRSWLAFGVQKLHEVVVLARALNEGRGAVAAELAANAQAVDGRRRSTRVHRPAVKAAVEALTPALGRRRSDAPVRARAQAARLKLPLFPTTTIGSFPQTDEVRRLRARFKAGTLDHAGYTQGLRDEVARCVAEQEALGLDVLVHGEFERNDMVEYFGERLEGFAFTQFGWVQSYGSRCVKPPLLFGDVEWTAPLTVEWITYAQSLTDKPMKGMLTGPVTLLNWSFVRDDQPRAETCRQLAWAVRQEVLALEAAGVKVIQIDEAALREGLPLRKSLVPAALADAVQAFRIAANGVADDTQIHTHMCYSEFNDILGAIAALDADVVTIENSRSHGELVDGLGGVGLGALGPGVYDIHSPQVPSVEAIVGSLTRAAAQYPADQLWVNPDCGLKTRSWDEVRPSLAHLVEAAKVLRARYPERAE